MMNPPLDASPADAAFKVAYAQLHTAISNIIHQVLLQLADDALVVTPTDSDDHHLDNSSSYFDSDPLWKPICHEQHIRVRSKQEKQDLRKLARDIHQVKVGSWTQAAVNSIYTGQFVYACKIGDMTGEGLGVDQLKDHDKPVLHLVVEFHSTHDGKIASIKAAVEDDDNPQSFQQQPKQKGEKAQAMRPRPTPQPFWILWSSYESRPIIAKNLSKQVKQTLDNYNLDLQTLANLLCSRLLFYNKRFALPSKAGPNSL